MLVSKYNHQNEFQHEILEFDKTDILKKHCCWSDGRNSPLSKKYKFSIYCHQTLNEPKALCIIIPRSLGQHASACSLKITFDS